MKKIVVGITGASGSTYAVRLIDVLREQGIEVHAVITDSGQRVLDYECGVTMEELARRVDVLCPNTIRPIRRASARRRAAQDATRAASFVSTSSTRWS